jgi:hypothetical protein
MGRRRIKPGESKRFCWYCKTPLTSENAYFDKNGYPVSACKRCNTLLGYQRSWKKRPTSEIIEKVQDLELKIRMLRHILAGR